MLRLTKVNLCLIRSGNNGVKFLRSRSGKARLIVAKTVVLTSLSGIEAVMWKTLYLRSKPL